MGIKIYGKDNCQYCEEAKAFLDSKGVPYTYLRLNEDFLREELFSIVPAARTFPQVVVNDQPIGGYDDLVKKWDSILEQVNGNREFLTEGDANEV